MSVILIYAQHLGGVGHYVRTYEIARVLAPHHDVHWIEGGRPVPHTSCSDLNVIELPRIQRGVDGKLQALDDGEDIARVMATRATHLLEQVKSIQPDLFLIEYFPFSKWELADELLPSIEAVRTQGGKVVCSLRDVVRKTRFEDVDEYEYTTKVMSLLNNYFDAVLVHADPILTCLEQHFSDMAGIALPIYHTGIVSEKFEFSDSIATEISRRTGGHPYVLASAGGGAGGQRLIQQVADAWSDTSIADGRLLVVCAGLGWSDELLSSLTDTVARGNCLLLPFNPDFLHWLTAADLSISQCGYNTAANLLETGTPAIVSPNLDMSDQPFRADRLANLGLVELFDLYTGYDGLADSVNRALNRDTVLYSIDLDGAERSRSLIEALLRE